MDLFDLLNTPIDDLYDMGILREPAPERDVLMCTITCRCSECGDEYTEDYKRQNVDRLIALMHCPECRTPWAYKLVRAIPYTIYYRSRSYTRASSWDDTRGTCWECGYKRGDLLGYTLSNGERIELCRKHFNKYHKHMYTLAQVRADIENKM